ncbi:hypothetical protein Hanom_Chr17g01568701 [Helianthus anomalus]
MADESPAVEEQEPLRPPSTTLLPVSKQTPSAPVNPLQLSNSTTPTWLANTSFTTTTPNPNKVQKNNKQVNDVVTIWLTHPHRIRMWMLMLTAEAVGKRRNRNGGRISRGIMNMGLCLGSRRFSHGRPMLLVYLGVMKSITLIRVGS